MKWLAVALPVLAIAACTVGPNYKRPDVTTPTEFRGQGPVSDASSLADAPWWAVFNDKALQALVTQALSNNLDVQVAIARIEQARAQVGVVQSATYPQIGYQAFAAGENTYVPVGQGTTLSYATFGGVLNAAWELDVWGRIRRATEAARADLLAQEDIRRGVMLTLVSDVAVGYFRLLELDRRLAIARESADVYKKNVDLFTYRFEAGRDNRLPVDRAQANYDASRERIADLTRAIGQQENVLSILVGGYPKAIERGLPLADQSMPQTPVGLTTDLMKRRPDILEAEQRMIAANAQIGGGGRRGLSEGGALRSCRRPGRESGKHGIQRFWPVEPGRRGRRPDLHRRPDQTCWTYLERQAYWDETIAQYKKTVLGAFRETSDALIAQRNLVDQRAALQSQVLALRHAVDIALLRYDSGRASYFEVLEAEQQLFPAEDAFAQTQGDQLVTVVNLYKALGGGWSVADAQWVKPN